MKNILQILSIIIILILSTLLLKECNNHKYDNKLNNHNTKVLNDSIRTYKTKNGYNQYQIGILQTNFKDLKSLNSSLRDEINSLKQKPEVIIKTDIQYIDSSKQGSINQYSYVNGKNRLDWEFVNDFSQLKGYTLFEVITNDSTKKYIIVPDSSFLTFQKYNLDLTVGIKKENGYRQIFVIPKNNKFTVTSLEGAILNEDFYQEKKPKLSFGIQLGYGITTGGISPYLGLGLNYNLLTIYSKKKIK